MPETIRRLPFSADPADALEYCHSDAVAGPGQDGGQRYGTSYLYVRLPGGPWARPHRRSLAYLIEAAKRYGSAREAFAALTEVGQDGGRTDG